MSNGYDLKDIAENYARKTELEIIAANLGAYTGKRGFDTAGKVAENIGGGIGGDGGNIVGTMIGLGMANPLGNIMHQHTQNALNNSSISVSNYDEIIELLRKLGGLKDLGVLTEQEFEMNRPSARVVTGMMTRVKIDFFEVRDTGAPQSFFTRAG